MMSYRDINIADYRYDLPPERIASYPLQNRDESKLLIYKYKEISQRLFSNLPELLPAKSLIIWNDTRVIPARIEFTRATGASIEIFLLEPGYPDDYTTIFNKTGSCNWEVIIGNQKKWKGEPLTRTFNTDFGRVDLTADYAGNNDKTRVRLSWSPDSIPFERILELFGKTPIPPYLKRDSDETDKLRYQTVYAYSNGSVAAPTAGLHFTPALIARLQDKQIKFNSLTLHVGSGTFVPVKTERIGDHQMHPERVFASRSLIMDLIATSTDNITVVGTTSLRSLESLYWLGCRLVSKVSSNEGDLQVGQWDPYIQPGNVPVRDSLEALLKYLDQTGSEQIGFITRLMIVPGYRFRFVKRLITNFHQPSSTLLLLVSALVGERWRDIYDYALSNDFRFLSYGDSSLLEIATDQNG